ncbi:MAG: FAD-dependent oxidoreductase [Myxococcales bacterium]|nr:FAD-dependent oxidoreductase [Myxococcales bacterium]
MKPTIAVVGAGAAGLAAAYALGESKRFDVDLFEASARVGGVAGSLELGGARFINDGVQAAAPSYANVLALHRRLGFEPAPISMRISFGRGETAWSNVEETPFSRKMAPEIARFGQVLRRVYAAGPAATLVPIGLFLRAGGFSAAFVHHMALPLVALFFGTGNQTHRVAASIVARVFFDPEQRLFQYDDRRLLSESPTMLAFAKLGDVYTALARASGARVLVGSRVVRVKRASDHAVVQTAEGTERHYDYVVFACEAQAALASLEAPSRLDRLCLGGVRYFDDLTVTHEDEAYMRGHYTLDRARGDQYLVHVSERDPTEIEMSFDLTRYQPQLRDAAQGLFQTIFLDERRASGWSLPSIRPERILARRWWHQLAPTWQHFARVVPLVRAIQGRNRTFYAGAWTLMNTHEIAVTSGFAAAARLGAPHPFAGDPAACASLRLYESIAFGSPP